MKRAEQNGDLASERLAVGYKEIPDHEPRGHRRGEGAARDRQSAPDALTSQSRHAEHQHREDGDLLESNHERDGLDRRSRRDPGPSETALGEAEERSQ